MSEQLDTPPEPARRSQKGNKKGAFHRNRSSLMPPVFTTQRPCLCCAAPFPSEGFHNRLCNSCRNLED